MRIVTHRDFHDVYNNEPAAARGRIQVIRDAIGNDAVFEDCLPAELEDILAVHSADHIARVRSQGLYRIASLAAGATIQAANIGMTEPCFALVRPPGHHAHREDAWGFCYFNNIAVAIESMKRKGLIDTAYVLDFDLHFGDGTVSILREKGYVAIHNPTADDRKIILHDVQQHLRSARVDLIAVSAGFDNHLLDWGGLLLTEDYYALGRIVWEACKRLSVGCFAVLEGGYNHQVLGESVAAFLRGLEGK